MNVIRTQSVDIALATLGEENRQQVLAWLEHLKNWDSDELVRSRVHKLNPNEDVYVLKAGPEFRIIFRLEDRDIIVLDIATRATTRMFGHLAEHARS
jgi:mRNA-degrading endonuclease RelE of RelBE toxin-antitoxin system